MSAHIFDRWRDALGVLHVTTSGKRSHHKARRKKRRAFSFETLEQRRVLSAIEFVADINPGPGHSMISNEAPYFCVFNDELYFGADNGTTGWELWKLDAQDTVSLAAEINTRDPSDPGVTLTQQYSSLPKP